MLPIAETTTTATYYHNYPNCYPLLYINKTCAFWTYIWSSRVGVIYPTHTPRHIQTDLSNEKCVKSLLPYTYLTNYLLTAFNISCYCYPVLKLLPLLPLITLLPLLPLLLIAETATPATYYYNYPNCYPSLYINKTFAFCTYIWGSRVGVIYITPTPRHIQTIRTSAMTNT